MAEDVARGDPLWYGKLGDAWDDWLGEREAFRGRIATLIGARARGLRCSEDCRGQGLRARC